MYQAIQTKYFSPTNVRGSRVKAIAAAGSLTLTWDHALNADANHIAAARALAVKLNWHYGTFHGGVLPDGTHVFVCHSDDARDGFTLNAVAAA